MKAGAVTGSDDVDPRAVLARIDQLEQSLQLTDLLVLRMGETLNTLVERLEILEEYVRLRLEELQHGR